MENKLPLVESSISDIYLDSQEIKTYMIPVYQRNYAWEEDEITELIKDVHDSFKKDSNEPYYIGTLVTYKRSENEYEVIDGQQRLTTIYIILKAMNVNGIRNRLTYRARKISASTIDNLDKYPYLGDKVDRGISNGYKFALKAIENIDAKDLEGFKKYFLDKVRIIHYDVPKDVDLNHYFEVMNSRGEQLEKHEIVKSWLVNQLKDESKEIVVFSQVWEACCEMNIYIQQVFDDKDVFGSSLDSFKINCFGDIPEKMNSEGKKTIKELLQQHINKIEDTSAKEQVDKFQPIIDFPNFLLIVLKITMRKYEGFNPLQFTLDDKELLNQFKSALDCVNDKAEFAKNFALNLLKAKYYLDNYIVHHSLSDKELTGDNPWKLQYYHYEKGKGYPVNMIGQEDQSVQDELIHLLSMFEVTFTPKQRKNYLFYCMIYLLEKKNPSGKEYLIFLRHLADKYFYDIYLNFERLNERKQPKPNAFDDALFVGNEFSVDNIGINGIDYKAKFEEIYLKGRSDVPLFVFNYTDYKLWKKYAEELRGNKTKKESKDRIKFFEELGCNDFGLDPFDNFYFSRTRKSLEHYYPQAKAGEGHLLSSNDINCFGNFAMIGADANSSGSNWDPKTKLDHYSDGKSDQVSVASLKFKIMMQKCKDNDLAVLNGKLEREAHMEWNAEDIQDHQEKMLEIIIR